MDYKIINTEEFNDFYIDSNNIKKFQKIIKQLPLIDRFFFIKHKRFHPDTKKTYGWLIAVPSISANKIKKQLRKNINKEKIPLQINTLAQKVGVDLLFVSNNQASKGKAFKNWLENNNISKSDCLKFADDPKGIDADLLIDRLSFNVGKKNIKDRHIVNTKQNGPDGVLYILDNLENNDVISFKKNIKSPINAIVLDMDGTCKQHFHKINNELLQKLVKYLENGIKINISTARGYSLARIIMKSFVKLGLKKNDLNNFTITYYSGAYTEEPLILKKLYDYNINPKSMPNSSRNSIQNYWNKLFHLIEDRIKEQL